LVGRHTNTAGFVCSPSTLHGSPEGDTAKSTRRDLGKLWTRVRQRGSTGQPTDWRRKLTNAECLSPAVRLLVARSALSFCGWRKEGLEGMPTPAPFDAQRQHPCGASGLAGDPTPDDPRSYSITLLTHPLNQEIRASVGPPARTGGRPRGACGEGACDRCGRPPVRRTLAPPFGLVTGPFLPVMRGRRPASFC
jgi:hypothetical protein